MLRDRLKSYFDIKGVSNKDLANRLEVSEALISRWMNSERISITFLYNLVQQFPDIDLNYIVKENRVVNYEDLDSTMASIAAEGTGVDNEIKYHLEQIELHTLQAKKLLNSK